ncbi:MAG: ATP-binding cassette domain-containing protein, partial [Chloroflexi bacterium]|nr:ATP-binding cassette domain-containing protein [Chloroflexota bacterium]
MLQVEHLVKLYPANRGLRKRHMVHAVDGVDLTIGPGETVGLVGESGSGKSTVGRCILRLEEPTGGQVVLDGSAVMAATGKTLRHLRSRMQMVYQDPFDSLNPRLSIGAQVAEPIWLNGLATKAAAREQVRQLLDLVGLPANAADRYAHQLSGGQQQRVAI